MGRWSGYGRSTVEQAREVDINHLRRAGYIGKPPGNWWVYRYKLDRVGIAPRHWTDSAITLDNQTLTVARLPWHFGGARFYFLFDCGRRVGKLFAPSNSLWRCRHCHDLTYATRQAAPRYRRILKAQKIRERLDGSLGVLDDFPPKPKGMHWRRYQRLRQTHDQAVASSLAMLASKRAWALATKLR